MRKILVVDDEKLIRAGIRSIIERANTSFTQIFEAKNGEEALEQLEKKQIDLVITDIKMPKMDGIALIKEINKRKINIQIIILSGYDEFSYAQDALRYGATAYLLKPVDKGELLDFVSQVEQDLEKKEALQTKESIILNNELNYIFLNDYITDEEIEKVIDTMQLDILKQPYYIAVLSLTSKLSEETESWIINEIDIYLTSINAKAINLWDSKGQYIMITNEINYEEFTRFLSNKKIKDVFLGVSQKATKPSDVKSCYHQAIEANKYKLLVSTDRLFTTYNEISSRINKYEIPVNEIVKVQQMLGTKKNYVISEYLDDIFKDELINSNDINYIEQINENIKRYIIYHYTSTIPQYVEPLREKFNKINDIYKYNHINEYVQDIRDYILDINDYLWQMKTEKVICNDIDIAIKYINKNYNKDLNMAIVANHVSLNYSYFSQLFKEHTNMNFIDYLKNIRVEKSKELLNDSNYKIYEVAEMVGYQNPKHYMKIFRSVTGISPSEYRNKIINHL